MKAIFILTIVISLTSVCVAQSCTTVAECTARDPPLHNKNWYRISCDNNNCVYPFRGRCDSGCKSDEKCLDGYCVDAGVVACSNTIGSACDTKPCCNGYYCHKRNISDSKSCQLVAFIGEDCSSGIRCDTGSQCINNKCSLRAWSNCDNKDNVCPTGTTCQFAATADGGDGNYCVCDGADKKNC